MMKTKQTEFQKVNAFSNEFGIRNKASTLTSSQEKKKFVVYREGDGKVLKSCDFYLVYLADLV